MQLNELMSKCEQALGHTILEHGLRTRDFFEELCNLLERSCNYLDGDYQPRHPWRLPRFLLDWGDLFLAKLPDDETMHRYLTYHDCGKPFCLTFDEQGRRHFPNHAEVSYKTFIKHGGDFKAGELIRLDMTLHTTRGKELESFCREHPLAPALYLAALAETHANAEPLFGGYESESFKIKCKRLEKAGKLICARLQEEFTSSRSCDKMDLLALQGS